MVSFLRTVLLLTFLVPVSMSVAQPPPIVRIKHEGYRTCVAFSPDGKTLATGGEDNHIRFWDVATARQQLAIEAHTAPAGVARLAYFADGKTLASSSWARDGSVKLWQVATGKQTRLIGINEGGVSVLAVSPDGRFVAWNNKAQIDIYDVKNDRVANSVQASGAVDSAAFSHDSMILATAHGGGTVHLWNAITGKPMRALAAKQTTATGSHAVAFSPDGKILATASGMIRLWNVANGEETAQFGSPKDRAFCVAISPDGKLLACGDMSSEKLRVWDLRTGEERHSWKEAAVSVAFSPDSQRLAFGNRVGGVGIVEVGVGGP